MLEAVSGGMTDSFEKSLRSAIGTLKRAGMTKETALRSISEQDYPQSDYDRWDTSKAEILEFIDNNWESF